MLKSLSILGIAFATVAAPAIAGSESHGGAGLACADAVYLYDLFEATIPHQFTTSGLTIARNPSQTMEQQLEWAFQKFGDLFSPELEAQLRKLHQHIGAVAMDVPANMSLVTPTDLH